MNPPTQFPSAAAAESPQMASFMSDAGVMMEAASSSLAAHAGEDVPSPALSPAGSAAGDAGAGAGNGNGNGNGNGEPKQRKKKYMTKRIRAEMEQQKIMAEHRLRMGLPPGETPSHHISPWMIQAPGLGAAGTPSASFLSSAATAGSAAAAPSVEVDLPTPSATPVAGFMGDLGATPAAGPVPANFVPPHFAQLNILSAVNGARGPMLAPTPVHPSGSPAPRALPLHPSPAAAAAAGSSSSSSLSVLKNVLPAQPPVIFPYIRLTCGSQGPAAVSAVLTLKNEPSSMAHSVSLPGSIASRRRGHPDIDLVASGPLYDSLAFAHLDVSVEMFVNGQFYAKGRHPVEHADRRESRLKMASVESTPVTVDIFVRLSMRNAASAAELLRSQNELAAGNSSHGEALRKAWNYVGSEGATTQSYRIFMTRS